MTNELDAILEQLDLPADYGAGHVDQGMNLAEMDSLIQACHDNADYELRDYYLKKRKSLVKDITKGINEVFSKGDSA